MVDKITIEDLKFLGKGILGVGTILGGMALGAYAGYKAGSLVGLSGSPRLCSAMLGLIGGELGGIYAS